MFNLGFTHIVLLGVIALIVVGPEQLPDLAKKLAHLLNDLRRAKDEIMAPMSQLRSDAQRALDNAKLKVDQDVSELMALRKQLDEQIQAQQKAQPSAVTPPIVEDPKKKESDGQPG